MAVYFASRPRFTNTFIVWQIAQRDYKFGKGKHRSLTKATYDAVGDHFRELWGKEAGWAHSVLFTADLRAFSERLTAKVEIKEETKEEEEAHVLTETVVNKIKSETAKREFEDDGCTLTIEETKIKTQKRRKQR